MFQKYILVFYFFKLEVFWGYKSIIYSQDKMM